MVDRHLLIRILGTTALTSLWPWLVAPPACANPQGATIVGGSALVVTTSPTVLNVDQASQNALINWRSFSVGAGEQTNFHQPSASSLTVNRVTGVDPSTIAGQITANGRIVLTNPNGVVVSQGARVNAGSFIATTSGITNSNAMAGNLDFTIGSSSPTASVVNRGRITVRQGGLAALVAPGVENDGVILARLGKVALASGQTFTLDLEGDRLVNFAVGGQVLSRVTAPDGTPLSAAVTNAGKIIARGGVVAISVDAAEGVVNQAINMTGIVQATSAHEIAGTIVLNGGAGGVVNLAGTLDASGNGAGESGGRITVRAGGGVMQTGTITASGAVDGGRVRLAAPEIINQGQISADAQSGNGGGIAIHARSAYIDTESSTLSAQSLGAGSGGSISVTGASTGSIFVSGTHSVRSATGLGGSIAESAGTVDLVGATINASGATGGGSIEVGGGPHGAGALADATATLVTPGSVLDADARSSGTGGNVVVWSNATTTFAGAITAQGGPAAGNGGMVEVSSKGDLVYAGTADVGAIAGTPGTLLLDPANITIESTAQGGSVAQYQLIEPDPTSGGQFGATVVTLASGNIVVANPGATEMGATDAGALYVYNGTSGQLVSMLTGSHASDQVGSGGVITLASGNFVAPSPSWMGGAGAVTWGSEATGVGGIVGGVAGTLGTANSLVGSTAGDGVGSGGVQIVGNGANYVVLSPNWNGGVGAATFGSGTAGVAGTISMANSLVGSAAGDDVGSGGLNGVGNGNYVVLSPNWNGDMGAATFGSGTSGVSGSITMMNSLVGSTPGDAVGSGGLSTVGDGNYVILSPNWTGSVGAATFGYGTTGTSGPVSAINSLVGSTPGDDVGSGGVQTVGNGANYVVLSPNWSSGGMTAVGAVTFGSSATGVVGPILGTNSLVGAAAYDEIGSGGVQTVDGGTNFVVLSPLFGSGTGSANLAVGAVTWGNGNTGFGGLTTVGITNSLIGAAAGDQVGSGGIVNLNSGDYVVLSPYFQSGGTPANGYGAITFASGVGPFAGSVSQANSLVGSNQGELLGSSFTDDNGTSHPAVVALSGDDYVIDDPNFSMTSATMAGAVVWADGQVTGTIASSSLQSLVGSTQGDRVGSGGIVLLNNGNFVVVSPDWRSSGVAGQGVGAVTWGNGGSGFGLPALTQVSASNSLTGYFQGDEFGLGFVAYNNSGSTNTVLPGVVPLPDGNYLVDNPGFPGGTDPPGVVVWANGTTAASGVPTQTLVNANSLTGPGFYDQVGDGGIQTLSNGNFVVLSPDYGSNGIFDTGLGAATFGNAGTGFGAQITVGVGNSLVGINSGDQVAGGGVTALSNGNYVVLSPYFGSGSGGGTATSLGAATWGSGTVGVVGSVTTANSLVGTNPGDAVGSGGAVALGSGDYVVLSPTYGSGGSAGQGYGAATWGNGASVGVVGPITTATSLVGTNAGDQIGSGGIADYSGTSTPASPQILSQFYLVRSPNYDNNAGALTIGNAYTGVSGSVTVDNSLIGNAPNAGLGLDYFDQTNDAVIAAENSGNGGTIVLGLFDPNLLTFARATGPAMLLSASSLEAALAIENVTLQATNDITVASNLTVTTGGYALELDAGGSITIEPNVVLALDGSFTAIANDTAASPQTGTGGITVMPGAVIDPAQPAPTGAIVLTVDLGGTPGPIDLASGSVVNGGTGSVTISAAGTLVADGTVMGSTVLARATGPVTLGGVITASNTGNSLTLVTGGAFTNTSGAGALATPNGNWLLYSQNPAADTIDGLPFAFKQYNAPYNTAPAVANADGLLYALAPIVSLTGVSKVYDGTTTATLAGNDTLTGVQSGDTVTLGASSGSYATRNAGTGIDVSFTNLAIASATDGSATVYGYRVALAQPNTIGTIGQEPLIVTAQTNTRTYDGTTSAAATPTVTSGTLYDSATLAETYASRNAGSNLTLDPSATIADGNGGNNYTVTLVANTTGVITPEMLTVTAAPNTKTYDGTTSAAAAPTVTSGTLYDPATLAETYASRNAGGGLTLDPSATIADGNGGNNYAVTLVANTTGVITPEMLTVTAAPNTKTYDGTTSAAAMPTVTSGTLYNGDTGSFSETYASANAATGITLTATGTITDPGNYALSFATNPNGVIDPALLTVTANGASRVYGTTNPNLTAAVSGLQGSDTTADLGLSVTTSAMNPGRFVGPAGLGGVATAGAPVGNYPVTAAITDTNYTLNLVPGTLMVTPAALDVVVNDASRLYGAANPFLTGSVIGLIGTDTAASVGLGFATTAIGGTPSAAGSNVGDYPITAAIASANYTLSSMPGVLAVDPAPLLVAVGNATRYVGQANPPFVSLVAGLAGADTAASIGLSFATSAIGGAGGVGGSPAGLYPITASFASSDYSETLIPGSLRILPAPANGIANVSFVIPQSFNIFQRTPQFFYLDSEVALSDVPPVPGGDQFATTSLHLVVIGTGAYEYLTNYFAPIDGGLLLPITP